MSAYKTDAHQDRARANAHRLRGGEASKKREVVWDADHALDGLRQILANIYGDKQ